MTRQGSCATAQAVLADQLTGPYLSELKHRTLAKVVGFVPNTKEEQHVVSALEQVILQDL